MLHLRKFFFILILISMAFLNSPGVVWGENNNLMTTDKQGEECFREARNFLRGLGMTIPRDILLKFRPEEEIQVQYISGGGRSISVGGYYQSHSPETIWIVNGQTRTRTIADMVHELTHAWQSDNCPLQDRMITEGLAVWCQYKALLSMGDSSYAKSMEKWDDPDYGGGLRLFLAIEKKDGIQGVIKFAKKETKPPKWYKDKP
jgi:hypothetical protein